MGAKINTLVKGTTENVPNAFVPFKIEKTHPGRGAEIGRNRLGSVVEEVADLWDIDFNRPLYLIDLRHREKLTFKIRCIDGEVGRNFADSIFRSIDDSFHIAGLFSDRNHLARLDDVRADVYFFAIDQDVSVRDQLVGGENCAGKLQFVDEVVEAAL